MIKFDKVVAMIVSIIRLLPCQRKHLGKSHHYKQPRKACMQTSTEQQMEQVGGEGVLRGLATVLHRATQYRWSLQCASPWSRTQVDPTNLIHPMAGGESESGRHASMFVVLTDVCVPTPLLRSNPMSLNCFRPSNFISRACCK